MQGTVKPNENSNFLEFPSLVEFAIFVTDGRTDGRTKPLAVLSLQ